MNINYNPIKVRSFYIKKIQYPSEDMLINMLEECYRNSAFSTFPKIIYSSPSYKSYLKYNSGNCISLSFLRNTAFSILNNTFFSTESIPFFLIL